MRLRLDRFSSAVRGRRTRGLVLLGLASALVIFAGFCFAALVMVLTDPRPVDVGATTFCVIAGMMIPLLGAGALLVARARYERGTRELQGLFTESTHDARIDRGALEARGWTRERADAVLLDALAHGLLADDGGTSLRAPEGSGWPQPLPAPPALPVISPYAQATPAPAISPYAQATPAPAISPNAQATPAPAISPYAQATPAPAISPYAQASPAHPPAIAHGAIPTPGPNDDGFAQTRAARRGSERPLPPPSVLTGRVLKSTYLVEEALGQGGMGAVWAARHLRTGRRYAVKTLLSTERFSRDAILRFEREARAASAIGHAGIVAVHDFDKTDDGLHYLVMDLLVGETLEARLGRSGRLAWSDARKIALEIAEALGAAHHAGILHRDLKPANVFLAQVPGIGERAVLVDFGLAKPIEESASQRVTSTGAVVGTALYMSPEQARGERVDVRSDVYGLATVIYEMLTGVPPFLGSSAITVMSMVLAEHPVAPSMLAQGLPAALDGVLLGALAKSPTERPPDVSALARTLASIAA